MRYSPSNARARHRGGGLLRTAVAAAALVGALLAPTVAHALPAEVTDAVTPSATSVDLFDYWVKTREAPDTSSNSSVGNFRGSGINKGHDLLFVSRSIGAEGGPLKQSSGFYPSINAWTGRADSMTGGPNSRYNAGGPYYGMVEDLLGPDGYPVLAAGLVRDMAAGPIVPRTTRQSLGYLFNPTSGQGKRAFTGVTGLFRYADGYYYYDSQKNYAAFDERDNAFRLYDTWGVSTSPAYSDQSQGQFFPFDSGEEVFGRPNLHSDDPALNHYFGLSVNADFMQPVDGKTSTGANMVFNFRGDDDVWVYVDDVLVGDVGGLHDRVALSIDFATGEVTTSDASSTAQATGNRVFTRTTIGDRFRAAGRADAVEGSTLRDGSYHTLRFFYLERGNGNSNLSLSFNLASIPKSTLTKVDQVGAPVGGAHFELRAADASYQDTGRVVGTGVTGPDGTFTLRDASGAPLNFDRLDNEGTSRYLLVETQTPAGYRTSRAGHLKYVRGRGGVGFLVSEDQAPDDFFATGVYARPEQLVTVPEGKVRTAGASGVGVIDLAKSGGRLVALPYRIVGGKAYPVWGSGSKGWHVSDVPVTSVAQLADYPDALTFSTVNGEGITQLDIGELPGDPSQYHYMNPDNYAYGVGYYFTTAKSADQINARNTRLIDPYYGLVRRSAANLYVTDVLNTLHVQKLDEAGTPLDGAHFSLYRAEDTVVTGGVRAPKDGVAAYRQGVTADHTANDQHHLRADGLLTLVNLESGEYYLFEDRAPQGYDGTSAAVHVVVDETGAHADAGVADDGITVTAGVGSLIDSMAQFGTAGDVDMTLNRIVATRQSGQYSQGAMTWADGTSTAQLRFDPSTALLEYAPVVPGDYGPMGFESDEGFVRAAVSQDPAGREEAQRHDANWTDLSGRRLARIFTGCNIVRVTNHRRASLEVTKRVEVPAGLQGPAAGASPRFSMTLGLRRGALPLPGEFDARVTRADGTTEDLRVSDGSVLELADGDSARVFGLPDGASYEVVEKIVSGYAQTTPAAGAPATGTVDAATTARADFVNAYAPVASLPADADVRFRKDFDAWDKVAPGTTFSMRLSALGDAPLPAGEQTDAHGRHVLVEVSDNAETGFGGISYDRPGTYTYTVSEQDGDALGVEYSPEVYRVVVTVAENRATATLEASYAMTRVVDAQGARVEQPVPDGVATFDNRFELTAATASLVARKEYAVSGLPAPAPEGAFEFALEAVTEGAPMPADTTATNAADGSVSFSTIAYGAADAGRTYVYRLREVPGAGPVSYDATQYYAFVTVTAEPHQDGADAVRASVAYRASDDPGAPTLGDLPTFRNAYDPAPAVLAGDAALRGTKVIVGRDQLPSDDFEFVLSAADAETAQALGNDSVVLGDDPAATTLTAHAAGGSADFSFGALRFSHPGTYRFEVRETSAAPQGMTNDATPSTALVEVVDDGTGALAATVTCDNGSDSAAGDRVVFVNSYEARGASAGVSVSKQMTGRDLLAGEFSFSIVPTDSPTVTAAEARARAGEERLAGFSSTAAARDESGVATADLGTFLAGIPFDQDDAGKAFSYLVSERPGALGGVTYDRSAYRVDLMATDTGDGTMAVEAHVVRVADAQGAPCDEPVEGTRITFANSYHAAAATSPDVTLSKALQGRGWTDRDSFGFRLVPVSVDGRTDADALASMPAFQDAVADASSPSGADGSVRELTFSGASFSQPGTYVYEARELGADGQPATGGVRDGVVLDTASVAVTVTVTDAGAGQLTASVAVADPAEGRPAHFVNSYVPTMTPDAQANLTARFRKVLLGRDWAEGDAFTFRIAADPSNPDAPMPARTEVTVHDATEAAAFGFGSIAYGPDDLAGAPQAADGSRTRTFLYHVTEDAPARPGVTSDGNVADVEVTVTDDGLGALAATVVVRNDTFRNTYAPGTVHAAGALRVEKHLTGRDLARGEFVFDVVPQTDDARAKWGDAGMTLSCDAALRGADGVATSVTDVDLGDLGLDDVGRDLGLLVTERNGGLPGVSYDAAQHLVSLSVGDDPVTATLHVDVTVDGEKVATWTSDAPVEPVTVAFHNAYAATPGALGGQGAASIRATKRLEGRPIVAGEFSFVVANERTGELVSTGTCDADGAISFEPVSYDTEKLVRDAARGAAELRRTDAADVYLYRYAVSEDASALPGGVTSDGASHVVEVSVADDRRGGLSVSVAYPEAQPDGLTFSNYYRADAVPMSLTGRKVLTAEPGLSPADITGRFQFAVTAPEGAPLPERTTATNDAAGNVDFGTVTFTLDDLNRALPADAADRTARFTYTVTESGHVPGVTNDPVASRDVTFVVHDDGDGTLSVTRDGETDAAFSFTNAYAVEPATSSPTDAGVVVRKELTGRDLRDGEFEFAMASRDGDMPGVWTARSAADGSVELPAVEFAHPGSYEFSLAEVDGELGGVTYDRATYLLVADVADRGDGTLSVSWQVRDAHGEPVEEAVFRNSYAAAPASLGFNAAKVLAGRPLVEGEFSFELLRDGEVVQTAANLADGSIAFAPVEFDQVGEHDFAIREVVGDAQGVSYDRTVFTYHVSVTDPGDGQLLVTWEQGPEGAPVFRNAYVPPAPPVEPGVPSEPEGGDQTGDEPQPGPDASHGTGRLPFSGDVSGLGALLAAACGGTALLAARRTRRRD